MYTLMLRSENVEWREEMRKTLFDAAKGKA